MGARPARVDARGTPASKGHRPEAREGAMSVRSRIVSVVLLALLTVLPATAAIAQTHV